MARRDADLPTYHERIGLEAIRGNRPLRETCGVSTVRGMIKKGWVVQHGKTLQITPEGIEAVKRKILDRQRS